VSGGGELAGYRGGVPEPLARVTLTGTHVQLEPLSADHVDELVVAANVDRSTYDYTAVPADPASMTAYIDTLLDDHAHAKVLPFAQRRLDTGALAGCTRYLDIQWWQGRRDPDEIEIGGTWLAADAQRTAINTEAKLLLLGYAFEQLGVWRVAVCTDARNERSRTAILRLGASFEGVLRNHRLRYNTPTPEARDTAVFSIIDSEWPAVKAGLAARLSRAS
jgi:RimJ/RimL family protein N-acetyltransferase